jgi:hypothetical protein
MKTCARCGIEKKNICFLKGLTTVSTLCNLCRKKVRMEYRAKNPEKIKAAHRKWYQENKEKHQKNTKAWVEENYGSSAAYAAVCRKRNPGRDAEASRRYRERNRELCRERQRARRLAKQEAVRGHAHSDCIGQACIDAEVQR